jgi:hypothetical protein
VLSNIEWSLETAAGWLTATRGTPQTEQDGTTRTVVTLKAAANSGAARTAHISLTGAGGASPKSVSVAQAAYTPPPPRPHPPNRRPSTAYR